MKSVGTRFLLSFGLIAVFISVFVLYQAYDASQRHADELISRQASLVMEFNLSIREYAASKIRPAFEALVDKDTFMPETMSTSYISRSIFEEVRKKFPDYIIRFASDNPRNPVNRATPDELRMIEYFRKNPGVERRTEEVRMGGRVYLAQFTPKWMTSGCMHCHGDPKEAPAGLIKRYGATASFYRKVGDVAGLDTVAMPVDVMNAALASEIRTESAILITGLIFLFGTIMIFFRAVVTRRLVAMANHIREIAAHDGDECMRPVTVSGHDEISVLGNSFNILLEKLHTARTSLEQQVSQRTQELWDTNEKLQAELMERKRSEAELDHNRSMLERAQEIARIGYWEFDLGKGSVWASSGARRIYGLEEHEWTIEAVQKIPLPEYRQALNEEMATLVKQGRVYDIEFKIRRPTDNEVIDIHSMAEYNPVERKVFGVIQDISERKRTEEALLTSESFLRSIFDQSPYPMWISDEKATLVRINQACKDMLHVSDEEVIGKYNILKDNIVEEQGYLPLVKRVFEDGETARFEIRYDSSQLKGFAMKQNAFVILNVTLFPVRDAKGRITNAVIQHLDITDLKQAEEALRKSEEKFSKVFRSNPAAIAITRLNDGLLIDANAAMLKLLRYHREEFIGQKTAELHIWADPVDRALLLKSLAEEKSVSDQETRFRAKDGEVIITRYSAEVVEIGGEACILSLLVDITKRRKAEEALQESEERYRALFENAIEGIFQTTLDGRAIMINSALARILGYDSAQEAVEKIIDISSQVYADPEERKALISRLLREGKVTGNEILFKRVDGTKIKVMLNFRLVHDKNGTPVSIEGSCIDITAKWLAEEALKSSEEKYRSIFENATEGIYQSTPDGRYLSVNPAFAKMAGYSSPQEMMDRVTNIGKEHYVNPLERDDMIRMLRENDKVEGFELEVYRKDKTTFWISINVHTVRGLAGNILYFEGTNVDITGRKQAELALRESEVRIREIIDNAPFGAHSYKLQDDGRLVFLGGNPAADRILNLDHSSLMGMEIEEAFPILKGTVVAESYRGVARTGRRWVQDVVQYKDKDIIGAFEVFAFQTGPGRMTAFFHDITRRKRAEEALRESEELLRTTINATADGILVVDKDSKVSHMNRQFAEMWHIPQELRDIRDEKKLLDFVLDQLEDPEGFRSRVISLYQSTTEDLTEIRFRDGRIFERYSCPMILEGKEVGRIWDFRDITMRKHVEEALRASEAKYRRLYDSMMDAFVSVDMDGTVVECNEAYLTMLGYDADEIKRFIYQDITPEKWHTFEAKIVEKEVLTRGYSDIYEKEYRRKDGTIFPVELRTYLLRDDEGRPSGMWAIMRDVTGRKQAEERLKEANRRLENIIEFLPDATLITDSDKRIIAWNRAIEEMTGVPKAHILGRDHFEAMVSFYGEPGPYLVDFIGMDDTEIASRYKNISRKGESLYAEVYTPALYQGKGAHIWAIASPLYDSDGNVIGSIESIRDITDRKRVEEALQVWMRRYDLIVEASGQVAYEYIVPTGQITWGRSIEKVLGYPEEEVSGGFSQWQDLVHPDDREATLSLLDAAEKACAYWDAQYRMRHRDGHYVWIRDRGFFLPDEGGKAYNQLGMLEDVTKRRRAEEELKKSEEKYRDIFEDAVVGIYQSTPDGRYLTVNPAFARIFGFDSPDEMVSGVTDIAGQLYANPEDRLRLKSKLEEDERFEGFNVQIIRKDGRKIWVFMNAHNVRDRKGKLLYYEGTCVDITDRKEAEDALRESERHLADIIEFLPDATLVIDRDGRVTAWNKAIENMTGVSSQDMIGRGNYEHSIPFYGERRPILIDIALMPAEEIEKKYNYLRREGDLIIGETDVPVVRGQKRFLSGWAQPIYDSSGEIAGAIECIRDSTDKRRAAEALEENEARYRLLAENASDIIFTMDTDLRFTYISSSVARIRGYTVDEAMTQAITEVLTKDSLDEAVKAFQEELEKETGEEKELWRKRTLELEEICKDGSTIWTETTFTPLRDEEKRFIGILGITRDITERKKAGEEKKRLEIQLTQAQKMESIGTLAGGIAHDFNNILSAIFGYTELAMEDVSEPMKVKRELKEVLKAGDRAKDLVSQILTFSRKTETTYSPMALRTIINESLKMLRSVIPTTIDIRQDLSDSGLVMSNPTQINQVMMNLCTNAVHAMDETGGVLQVSLKKVSMDEGTLSHDLDLLPGPYLRITVSDTGHGMPPEVMERIFEPYFTTKELGRGTGLGLSVVHGIVKSHKGAITCRSLTGEGTTFEVYLPEILSAKDMVESLEENPVPTGTERILFIDDEPVLVKLAKKILGNLGYEVIGKTSSVEALELFQENPDEFDLIITDMTMPGMTGERLAQEILKINPDIPIILCTGYSEYITEERAKRIGIREFLLKPLEVKKLAGAVRNVLDDKV